MQNWEIVILYVFLGAIVFHLIVDDVVFIIKECRRKKPNTDDDDGESNRPSHQNISSTNGEPNPNFLPFGNSDVENQTTNTQSVVNSVYDDRKLWW